MLKKYLSYILIITGIAIISIALYQKISTSYYQKKLVEEYDRHISMLNSDVNEESEVVQSEVEIPGEEIKQESREEHVEEVHEEKSPVEKYLEGKEISGIIEIPKLNVKSAILEGTDDSALKYTVGHYPETANPGEKRNCVLLGHRNYVYGHFFRRIDELEPGDQVILKKDAETYTYIVTESFVVSPEEVWVLDNTEDATVTMITCTPMITYTDRLIVRGVLSDK
ncbi:MULTISPECIES: class D sortase [unclassified Sedimentibacter]|uniref:class D sortase n=1 Tax=unclassified Sedimentibacter TaxID=2649220 RepID=UPI0027E1FAD2|nr:class D sortase [Sedimentibacter sp. MB35-C1]WMJ76480.1 class D sortase [Sedimentibacter sp. MB35-C1]